MSEDKKKNTNENICQLETFWVRSGIDCASNKNKLWDFVVDRIPDLY